MMGIGQLIPDGGGRKTPPSHFLLKLIEDQRRKKDLKRGESRRLNGCNTGIISDSNIPLTIHFSETSPKESCFPVNPVTSNISGPGE